MFRPVPAVALVVGCLLPGCRSAPDGTSGGGATSAASTSGDGGTETDTDTGGPVPFGPTNVCETAFFTDGARIEGTLANATTNLGGACGQGGPDHFIRLTAPLRADVRVEARGTGFVPVVGVLRGDCSASWAGDGALCTEGLPGWVLDVDIGESVVVVVGSRPDEPALTAPVEPGEPDPLRYLLDVGIRPVWSAGELCHAALLDPNYGRCEPGTACLADEDQIHRCTTLPADTCQSPGAIVFTGDPLTVDVDPAAPQTDAHYHSCGGARWRERVFRIALPETLPPGDLRVSTLSADLTLAVRAPDCRPESETDCAPARPGGAHVTVPDVHLAASAGTEPLLFVEVSSELPGDAPPIPLQVEHIPD